MLPIALTGLVVVSATVLLHAGGTAWWLRRLERRGGNDSPAAPLRVLVQTAVVLVVLHVAEVFVWAVVLRFLPDGGIASLGDAMYLSFATFTTLGYGDVTVEGPWRLLTGVEALNGVILLGWSTALSFAVIQRVWARS